MLKYFLDYKDPMIYSTFKAEMDQETGVIKGEIILEQYAIAGGDRKLDDVVIDPDIDKYKMRGVDLDETNEHGIFGTTVKPGTEEGEEEGEGEEGGEGEGGEGNADAGADADGGADAGDAAE